MLRDRSLKAGCRLVGLVVSEQAATALTEAGSSCQELPFRVQAWKWLALPGLSAAGASSTQAS
jgi:hypothetical protein